MKHTPNISAVRRRKLQDADLQHRLFTEIVEIIETRDTPFEDEDGGWGSRVTRPPGAGWRVLDSRRERHTKWQRFRAVPWAMRPTSNGWRRP